MLAGLIRRAVVVAASHAAGQLAKLQLLVQGETEDTVEHLEPYGLAATPPAGAHALVLSVGGDAGDPVVVAVSGGTGRPTGLASGAVALYDASGQTVTVSAAGGIQLGASASAGVARTGDAVQVTIPIGAIDGVNPVAPVVVTGTITGGSATVKAVS